MHPGRSERPPVKRFGDATKLRNLVEIRWKTIAPDAKESVRKCRMQIFECRMEGRRPGWPVYAMPGNGERRPG